MPSCRSTSPAPGWVEHDPEEIWQSVLAAAGQAGLDGVDTIAITNQRETTLLWDRATGRPVAPAIVWQDRRTAERCRELDAGPDPRAHGARSRSVLLGDQARVAAARARAPGARVRHGRHVARLEAHRRRRARDGRDERIAHAARLAADAGLGRRAARALRRRPRAAAAHRPLGRGGGGGRAAGRPLRRFAGSPATSRRRSTARAAMRRAKGRRPTGPAASCSCTRATTPRRRRAGC